MNSDNLENQALEILEILNEFPFEQCAPIIRDFTNLTANASLYAIRHRLCKPTLQRSISIEKLNAN